MTDGNIKAPVEVRFNLAIATSCSALLSDGLFSSAIRTHSSTVNDCAIDVEIKNKIVISDPKEKGERKKLNFGHTFGHALEAYYKYSNKLTHGEAISIGMFIAATISQKLKYLSLKDLNKIKSCIKLTGFVNSTDNFIEQPKVINGASDLIASVFGDLGMHTRAAVSTNSLPLGVAVEVDAIFELN